MTAELSKLTKTTDIPLLETPSQGIIAQTPQFVSNMHFSTRTLKTFANSEKKNWGPGCSKLHVYHTIIIIPQAIPLKINSEGSNCRN